MSPERPFDEVMHSLEARPQEAAFRPCAWYNPDGDAWEIYLTPEPHVAERVDPLFTVLVADADRNRVVGVVIKNIKKHFGPAGLTSALCATGHATVRLLLQGALFAHEYNLIRHPDRRSSASQPNASRVQEILDQVGDVEVDLTNREALVGQ